MKTDMDYIAEQCAEIDRRQGLETTPCRTAEGPIKLELDDYIADPDECKANNLDKCDLVRLLDEAACRLSHLTAERNMWRDMCESSQARLAKVLEAVRRN
jgi:hypothetical protein